MEPRQISKKTAIEKIVEEYIKTSTTDDNQELETILIYGNRGYLNYTCRELQTILKNMFDDEYVINDEL